MSANGIPVSTTLVEPPLGLDVSIFTDDDPSSVAHPLSTAGIVQYLTSPSVMDYVAMSDFFLTFRLFCSPREVLDLLLTRLWWAMSCYADDDIVGVHSERGRDIGVRTFVVLRYWVLNFFADDFLPNFELRQAFADSLNVLSRHQFCIYNTHFQHIFSQLKRCWNTELCTYWDAPDFNDDDPLSPGGQYGAAEIDKPGRRLTLLSFYSGPISPIGDSGSADGKQLGNLIRGGLLIDTNVAVPFIRTTPLKVKKSRLDLFRHRKTEEPREQKLENKVDLLALRVLLELRILLKMRSRGQAPVPPIHARTSHTEENQSEYTISEANMPISSSLSTLKQSDTLNIDPNLDESYSDEVDLRRSTAAVGGGLLDQLDIERVSMNSFSSLSTLSRGSRFSMQPTPRGHMASTPVSDRQSFVSCSDVERTQISEIPQAQDSKAQFDFSNRSQISLLSELSTGYEMAPCAGFNNQIAAELAAIPDDSLTDDDALLVTLQKLEGTYQPHHKIEHGSTNHRILANAIRSVPSFVTSDSKLFSEAFASASNLAGTVNELAIPQSSPISRDDHYTRFSSSTATKSVRDSAAAGFDFSKEHVPFILSLSAETLAEQMTLLEKDALDQIDWKELVEMRWSQAATAVDSWLGFLATENARGADIVTARFNLVVNWVRSEILLCRQATMKASTISRFIAVAAYCRKIQNFATTFQIVLALGPIKTFEVTAWSLLCKRDKEILSELDQLMTPLKNFQKLRQAHKSMEFSKGCIPFTGLYLMDLTYNNQKPNVVNGKINFSKFQTTSLLVRSLMQCIEWARNYRIMPKPDILSKCLYLQSLSTSEMKQFGMNNL